MPSNFKKLVRARMEKTGETYQTAARHVRGVKGSTAEPRLRVWSHDITFFVAPSRESAKQQKDRLRAEWGDRLPWLLRDHEPWFEIEGNRELRLDNGTETNTRTAQEWASRLPAGFMAVIDMNTGTLQRPHWLQEVATRTPLVTYFAVVHGEPRGTQTFGPIRKAPMVSRLVFEYRAAETSGDDEMRRVFDMRFLPLKISFFDADGRQRLSDDYSFKGESAFEEARAFASALLSRAAQWVVIATKDDRVISIRPSGVPKSSMPFPIAEYYARHGSIIGRVSWPAGQFLPAHGPTPGSYTMRFEDGRMETWTPADEDRNANDWTSFGPVIE